MTDLDLDGRLVTEDNIRQLATIAAPAWPPLELDKRAPKSREGNVFRCPLYRTAGNSNAPEKPTGVAGNAEITWETPFPE